MYFLCVSRSHIQLLYGFFSADNGNENGQTVEIEQTGVQPTREKFYVQLYHC